MDVAVGNIKPKGFCIGMELHAVGPETLSAID